MISSAAILETIHRVYSLLNTADEQLQRYIFYVSIHFYLIWNVMESSPGMVSMIYGILHILKLENMCITLSDLTMKYFLISDYSSFESTGIAMAP